MFFLEAGWSVTNNNATNQNSPWESPAAASNGTSHTVQPAIDDEFDMLSARSKSPQTTLTPASSDFLGGESKNFVYVNAEKIGFYYLQNNFHPIFKKFFSEH